ncbi:MAG: TMEM43 family protein [Bacteroidales bacterium]|nr:TMEM43 family protein [Bacteroidales bacterium]
MAYTETHRNSYGSRVGNSFRNIGSGFVLIIAASVLLWWNEGRAVKTAKMLDAAADQAVHVDDMSAVNPENEGKLIHANAFVSTEEYLSDPTFGVGAVTANLHRNVEFYQWMESSQTTKKDKIGGAEEVTTTYTYNKGWTGSPVDSDSFKDPEYQGLNSTLMNTSDESYQANVVKFGAYNLPKSLISSIPCHSPLANMDVKPELINEWNAAIKAIKSPVTAAKDSTMYVHVVNNTIYLGRSPQAPEIGDVRITFTQSNDGDASILAVVDGNSFKPFTHKNGKSLCTLSMGTKTMEEMFEAKEKANTTILWIIRILGILICCGGFYNIFGFLVMILKVIPFLSKIANLGVKLVSNILGTVWSLVVILIAWFRFRPLLSIGLLVVACALVALLVMKSKNAPAKPEEPAVE